MHPLHPQCPTLGGERGPPAARCDGTEEIVTELAPTQADACRVRVDFASIPDTIPSADGSTPCPAGGYVVNHSRRLSQAISEGDGISLLVPVDRVEDAQAAESDGAEGIVVTRHLEGLREATALPILYTPSSPAIPLDSSFDACLLRARGDIELRDLTAQAQSAGLETVIGVRDDQELEVVLENIDPEILLLAPDHDDDEDPLEQVLDLLPDVPAGKLAIAEVQIGSREDVVALERAGVDAVIVGREDVARLVGGAPPEV